MDGSLIVSANTDKTAWTNWTGNSTNWITTTDTTVPTSIIYFTSWGDPYNAWTPIPIGAKIIEPEPRNNRERFLKMIKEGKL